MIFRNYITFVKIHSASRRLFHISSQFKSRLYTVTSFKSVNDQFNFRQRKLNSSINAASVHTSRGNHGREFYLDKNVELRIAEEAKEFPYALHELEFKTCEEYNEFLHRTNNDRNRSLSGIRFKASYVDTHPDAGRETPVVLALHGTPGNHLDFKEIIKSLAQRGIRVIAPNFPGFGWTPTDVNKEFRHSFLEKSFFIKDFLWALNIPKVDMIVAHSAGTYPGLLLCSEFKLSKSMVLINPGGLSLPRSLEPVLLYAKFHIMMYRNLILRPLLLATLKLLLVLSSFGNTNAHHMTVAFESLMNVNHDACKTCIQNMTSANFPITLIYSESDRVVDKDQFEEYVSLFGGSVNNAYHYDNDGSLKSSPSNNNSFAVHIFDGGGHFVMKKYPEAVNNITYQFFQKIRSLK